MTFCHMMPLNQCCHYMIPLALVSGVATAPSIAPLHSSDQDDQNEVQHDFFGHVTLLFQPCHHAILTVLSMAPLHFLGQDNSN